MIYIKGKYYRWGLVHCSVVLLLIMICSLIIMRRNANLVTVDSDRGLTNQVLAYRDNHFPRTRAAATACAASGNSQTLSQHVDELLTNNPFSVNGFSPIAADHYGFDQKTINLLNSHIMHARVSVANLICANLIAVKDEKDRPNAIQSYEYKANLDEALSIKDDLVQKINLATGKSLDSEIDRMLGGNPGFLFCGTTNFKFTILSQENNGNQDYVMEYSCETVDGVTIFSNYRCDLRSFSNSTLIDFDLPNTQK
jgi:hypothetical protein